MIRSFRFLASLCLATAAVAATAAAPALLSPAWQALQSMFPSAPVSDLEPSSLEGFQSAVVGGQVVYVSNDGGTVILGNVYKGPQHTDIGAQRLTAFRKTALASIPAEQRISFSPPHPKYHVTAFIDIDCPYCRKLHEQIAQFNAAGIAIDYVLFPLDIHPNARAKAQAVWCEKDRKEALSNALNGQEGTTGTCANPIDALRKAGMAIGVNGTPALYTADGVQVGGYVTPEQLLAELNPAQQVGIAGR